MARQRMRWVFRLLHLVLWVALASCGTKSNVTGGGSTGGGSSTGGGAPGGTSSGGTSGGIAPAPVYTAKMRVTDIDGNPVPQSTLTVNGVAYNADSSGTISVANLSVVGAVSGQVTSPNCLPYAATLSYSSAGQKPQSVMLSKPAVQQTISASAAANVDMHSSSVSLSPNSMVNAANQPATGSVTISASGTDTATEVVQVSASVYALLTDTTVTLQASFNTDSVPTGVSTMQLSDGTLLNVYPEGVVQIAATDSNGNALSISAAAPAVIRINLTPYTLHRAGDILPIMVFQAASTMWIQQGNCVVQAIAGASSPSATLQCVGAISQAGMIAVPASAPTSNFPCANFAISFSDVQATVVSQWVEEIQPGDVSIRARRLAPNLDGSMCYLGGSSTVRVAVEAQVNGQTQIFRSANLSLAAAAMASQDIVDFNNGATAHACFKCGSTPVVFGRQDGSVAADDDGDGYYTGTGSHADCDDTNPLVHPGAAETVCDSVDKNCDGVTPNGSAVLSAAISPAQWNQVWCRLACAQRTPEIPGNLYDEDCDGIASDADNDTFLSALDPQFLISLQTNPNAIADCDDQNPSIHPGVREVAGNIVDEDCDGYAVDADNDGYIANVQARINVTLVDGLRPIGDESTRFNDCQDFDASINPSEINLSGESVLAQFYVANGNSVVRRAQLCTYIDSNGILNTLGRSLLRDVNCDGVYSDLDGDGYTVPGDLSLGAGNDIDCNDFDPRLNTQSGCVLAASMTALDGGTCSPSTGHTSTTCPSGYQYSSTSGRCEDINECLASNGGCDPNQICVNVVGSVACRTPVALVVAGSVTVDSTNPNGGVTFTAATGGTGAITYAIFLKAGTFASSDPRDIMSGNLMPLAQVATAGTIGLPQLAASTPYSVAIIATDSMGEMAVYTVQTFTTPPPSPPPPPPPTQPLQAGSLSVYPAGTDKLIANISPPTGGVGSVTQTLYMVIGLFRDNTVQGVQDPNARTAPVSSPNMLLASLSPNTTYSVAVIASDGNSTVLYAPQTATTAALPVAGTFSLSNNGNDTLSANFSPVQGGFGAISYAIYVTQGSFSSVKQADIASGYNPSQTTRQPGSVALNTGMTGTYSVAIIATDFEGNTAFYGVRSYTFMASKMLFPVTAGGNLTGMSGLDALCQAGRPNGVKGAKAFLTDGVARVACQTSGCSGGISEHMDWVLSPNTMYYRADGNLVAVSDSAGLFDFPLSASAVLNGGEWWTGLSMDWTAAGADCNGWTSISSSDVGMVGQSASVDDGFLTVYTQNCNRSDPIIICAEQ